MGYENDPFRYRDEDGEPLMDYDDGFQSDQGDDYNNNNHEQHHHLLDDNLEDEIEDTDWQSNRESTPVLNEIDSKSKPRKRLIKKSTADEPLPDFPVDDDVEDEMAAFVRDDEFSGGGKWKKFFGDGGSGSKRKEKKSSFSKFSEKPGRGGSEKSAMKFKGNSSSKRSGRSGGGDDAEVKEMWDTISGGDSERIKKMALKEIMEALRFICTFSFWRMVFLWTFPLIISYIQLLNQSIFSKIPIYNRFAVLPLPPITLASTPGRRLPICVITGATSGLGAAAALALSKEGFFVVLAGRSPDKLSKVMSDIKKQNKEAHLEAFQVDLSSFSSIMRFKESLETWLLDLDTHPSIQLLINNAGILATTSGLTNEGHDRMMGTNYIGAFSLTEMLLPLVKKSPVPSRILNLTSFTHRNISSFRTEKEIVSGKCFSELKHYPCAKIYEYSKLCILLFSYELHRQLHLTEGSQPISVMAVDPGAAKTNIMREVPFYISQVAFFMLRLLGLLQSPEAGISSILDAALAPPEMSGLYFFGGNGRTVDSSALSYNIKLSRELWDTSRDIFNDSLLIYNRISDSSEKVD